MKAFVTPSDTCMLLYLLKVLLQTGQENWVGPTRIWAGDGIQYFPSMRLGFVLTLLVGRPIWRATVTLWSWWRWSWVVVVVADGNDLSSFWPTLGIERWWWWWIKGLEMWWWWWCCPGGPRERRTKSSSSNESSSKHALSLEDMLVMSEDVCMLFVCGVRERQEGRKKRKRLEAWGLWGRWEGMREGNK